jgi:hypothetical protein
MAINRRFLYAGLFLVALGGVLVLVDLAVVDTAAVSSALRLWPLAIIAIGAGIVFRRSRYALVAGVLAAMVPGLVLGGGLAVAPRHGFDCGTGAAGNGSTTQQGTFTGTAAVAVDISCGSISIATQAGHGWQLTNVSTTGREPRVDAAPEHLVVASADAPDSDWLEGARDTWQLTLPTSPLGEVWLKVNAGRASVDLADASLETLALTGNGADISIDANTATMHELNGELSFGQLGIDLPAHAIFSGSFRVGAGRLLLCVPPSLGLRVNIGGQPREVRVNGLPTDATSWENELYQTSTNRADLSVKVNFGSVLINPIGGCK